MKLSTILAALLLLAAIAFAQEIPVGTAVPVILDSKLDARKAKPGQKIIARVAQDVPLPDGKYIPRNSEVRGKVVEVRPPAADTGSQVIVEFDRIHTKRGDLPVTTGVRAIASIPVVAAAQEPWMTQPIPPSPPATWTTLQIGGQEAVYRGGGQVMTGDTVVGTPVAYGVLGRFRSRPGSKCTNEGNDREQALWLFATTACGIYGYHTLNLAHSGMTDPVGQITLASKENVQLYGGSGLLLVTTGSSAAR